MRCKTLLAAGAIALGLNAGLAQAKIPVAPMDEAAKAKAEEAKAKAAAAAKLEAEQLAKAQDRVAERYKKGLAKEGKEPGGAKAHASAKK